MTNEDIRKFIEENPKYLTGNYQELADHFNITIERARHQSRKVRKKLNVGSAHPEFISKHLQKDKQKEIERNATSFKENFDTGEASLSLTSPIRIKTKDDLIKVCQIDLTEYEITGIDYTAWEGYRKGKEADIKWNNGVMDGYVKDSGKLITETLYRVNVKLKRRKLDTDLQKQKELILEEIKAGVTPSYKLSELIEFYKEIDIFLGEDKYLLEIALPDVHFGKLSHHDETGEDYDLKIAEQRFKSAIIKLLAEVKHKRIERILFPIGNDLINVDNKNNTTTAGTPQDTDSRFYKIIKTVRRVLVEVINDLSLIAPVDVVIVPGNHDETMSFLMGEILDAFYYGNDRVNIDCRPTLRKYYQYGTVGIQLTHGDQEKHHDLGQIFATERAKLWADTYYRYCQLGHFHKAKKIEYVSVDEYQGFQVQVLPSLSGRDNWHNKKGYMSMKAAKAFLFHETEGCRGEFTVTI